MKDLAAKWQLHRTTVAACLRRADVELRRQGVRDGVTDIEASECEAAATVGASLKKESGTMSPSSRSSSWVLSFSRRTIYIKRMGSSLHEHVTVLPSPIEGLGLFAIDAISQGEQVAQFDDEGAIMTDDEFEKFRQSTNDDFDAIALGNGLHRVSK